MSSRMQFTGEVIERPSISKRNLNNCKDFDQLVRISYSSQLALSDKDRLQDKVYIRCH